MQSKGTSAKVCVFTEHADYFAVIDRTITAEKLFYKFQETTNYHPSLTLINSNCKYYFNKN